MSNPYLNLDKTSFWKTGVAELSPFKLSNLWTPKLNITPQCKIVTAGSCFAQHIGRALVKQGYNWFDAEAPPDFISEETKQKYNYGVFSFKTGNIYTTKMLHQWLSWAFDIEDMPKEYWKVDGKFIDPFRPKIEPGGFDTLADMKKSRAATLHAIRRAVETADVFVFTLGLTESWRNKETGIEYAACPGVSGGTYDPEIHEFFNHDYTSVRREMMSALKIIRQFGKRTRILLTVSPVPLTATASDKHVLTATTYSKSVLRAVAGDLSSLRRIDYFPSYEIITSPPFGGMFYDANKRTVLQEGVDFVMKQFFNNLRDTFKLSRQEERALSKRLNPSEANQPKQNEDDIMEVKCEEELLNAFAK